MTISVPARRFLRECRASDRRLHYFGVCPHVRFDRRCVSTTAPAQTIASSNTCAPTVHKRRPLLVDIMIKVRDAPKPAWATRDISNFFLHLSKATDRRTGSGYSAPGGFCGTIGN